jgi:hypothetical protein
MKFLMGSMLLLSLTTNAFANTKIYCEGSYSKNIESNPIRVVLETWIYDKELPGSLLSVAYPQFESLSDWSYPIRAISTPEKIVFELNKVYSQGSNSQKDLVASSVLSSKFAAEIGRLQLDQEQNGSAVSPWKLTLDGGTIKAEFDCYYRNW